MNRARKHVPKRTEDATWLAQFKGANDEAAFAQIVRKYEDLVWNICCRVLHNRHDAEDAFQQTFFLLAVRARRIRKPNSLSSWLYGVAFRTASSIRRRRQRDMLPYETTADASLTDDVLEFVARKNENELVSAEIMLMKDKHRTPLLMFYFMGDSTATMAETLGITVSAVEGRLRQARRALRSQLRLRGVDFDATCAALVIPVLPMTPALATATIKIVLTASATGLAGSFTSYLMGLKQTGAKLMLSKLAVSISILCVASIGALHSGAIQDDGTEVTQVQSTESEPDGQLPIKIVVSDDEQSESKSPSERVHQHLLDLHDHAYAIYKSLFKSAAGEKTIEVFIPEDSDIQNERARVVRVENMENQFIIDLNVKTVEGQPLDVDVANQFDATFQAEGEEKAINVFFTPSTEVPLLHKVPYLGRLFRNATPKKQRFTLRNVESEPNYNDNDNEDIVVGYHWVEDQESSESQLDEDSDQDN